MEKDEPHAELDALCWDPGDSSGYCLMVAEQNGWPTDFEAAAEQLAPLRDLLSSCKQWRQATESRLRLTGSRGEAVPLKADQALFDAIDRAEGK